MRFVLIRKETVVTRSQCIVVRIMAVTDQKAYKDCKLIGEDTVKLQRRIGKGKYDTFATAKDLYSAATLLESYINTFTCGQKCVRI